MAPLKSDVPPAAQPKFGAYFDAWNSSSTGHQRAENRLGGSTGWRQSRSTKLSHQFKSGQTGGKRISDTVGAGSEDWDEKLKILVPKSVRERVNNSVQDMLVGKPGINPPFKEEMLTAKRKMEDTLKEVKLLKQTKGLFDGLIIYISGSTHPIISDHKLKHTLAENGAKLSLHLGRKQVTHVILGRHSGASGSGAGGGLAGTKIEKEIQRGGSCGVKYVGVEWVLESIRAKKRLPETQFTNLKIAAKGQQSVYGMFKNSSSAESSDGTGLRP